MNVTVTTIGSITLQDVFNDFLKKTFLDTTANFFNGLNLQEIEFDTAVLKSFVTLLEQFKTSQSKEKFDKGIDSLPQIQFL